MSQAETDITSNVVQFPTREPVPVDDPETEAMWSERGKRLVLLEFQLALMRKNALLLADGIERITKMVSDLKEIEGMNPRMGDWPGGVGDIAFANEYELKIVPKKQGR